MGCRNRVCVFVAAVVVGVAAVEGVGGELAAIGRKRERESVCVRERVRRDLTSCVYLISATYYGNRCCHLSEANGGNSRE